MTRRPAISIVIPTYNRAQVLAELLSDLTTIVARYPGDMEVVVGDNASEDATPEVCRAAADRWEGTFRYLRRPENLGVSRNIVHLFHEATGRFILLIGDDDRLDSDGVDFLMKAAREENPPAAFVQVADSGPRERMDFRELAERWFYRYGNAYAGVVERDAAVQAVERRGLRSLVDRIVWPQTVFGMLAAYDHQDRGVGIIPCQLGSSDLHDSLNVKTFAYHSRSFIDLLTAAQSVDRQIGTSWAEAGLLRFRSQFFQGHVFAMLGSILTEDVSEGARAAVVDTIRSCQVPHAWAFGRMVGLLLRRNAALPVYYTVKWLLRRQPPRVTYRQIREVRAAKRQAAVVGVAPGVRFGDYFDAPDSTSRSIG